MFRPSEIQNGVCTVFSPLSSYIKCSIVFILSLLRLHFFFVLNAAMSIPALLDIIYITSLDFTLPVTKISCFTLEFGILLFIMKQKHLLDLVR